MYPTTQKLKIEALFKSEELRDFLAEGLALRSCHIFLLHSDGQTLSQVLSHPSQAGQAASELALSSPLGRLFASDGTEHLSAAGQASGSRESSLARDARKQLKALGADHAFRLCAGRTWIGLLAADGLSPGQSLPAPDARGLRLFVRQLNAFLGIMLAGESLDLVAQLSSGLAHDLRGWLTPVTTCLQLYGAGPQGEKKAAKLRPEALKSLDAVQACLEQARYFSKHHALKIQPVRLPGILDKALDLLKSTLTSKRVRVSVRAGDNLQAEVDEVLILRLLDNLLTNAIRATPAGSDIHVSIERTGASARRPAEIVLRITNPTAEAPAESNDASASLRETADAAPRDEAGWGLGLKICREIAQLHGGALAMTTSDNPPATTVQVTLPGHA